MDFDDFTGQVQNRLELPGTGEALTATRAVLTTLGERVPEGEATNTAGPLPREIDRFLIEADHGQRFDFQEFVARVAEREGSLVGEDAGGAGADAAFHARAIVALLDEIVPGSQMDELRDALPEDEGWETLFELVDAEEVPWERPENMPAEQAEGE